MASGAAQRAIGVAQILGGLLYSAYGGMYGGRGGGGYLIGSGITNVSGSKYGSARRGTTGFYQDLYGSLGAAGASMGLGGGRRRPEEEDPAEAYTPYLKALMTQQQPIPMIDENRPTWDWSPEFLGLQNQTPLMRDDVSAAAPAQSNIFGGLRKLLLGEYA